MITHYNAFISYKHAPLDTKVASEVQRQLERFNIPGSIRKSTGIKRIDRIFRDKEELTLTSDLNETIENALQNSDYLIVICSNSTKQSVWVLREIEFFLKTHSRKQILTVVAEGEPCDVVPEILQYQEMELPTEDGDVETVRVPIEPLSCDYRGDFKKARREELPRLAAALLGCSYDELRRRQRQYRMRRITAAAAAVGVGLSALAAYYAWSAAQIRENYEQSLRNQSDYLASESQKLLQSGDRLSAALLALEGLPTEDLDRPITAKAVNALSQAIYAYRPQGVGGMMLSHAFTHPGAVDFYEVHEETGVLAAVHSGYDLIAWNMEAGTQLLSLSCTERIQEVAFTPDGDLLVLAQKLFCYSADTMELRWEYGCDTHVLAGGDLAVFPDGSRVLVEHYDEGLILDVQTGERLLTLQTPLDDYDLGYNLSYVAVSPDGKHAAGTVNDGCVVIWDTQTGEMTNSTLELGWTQGLMFLDDGSVMVAAQPKHLETSMTVTLNDGTESRFLYPGVLQLHCVDLQGNTLWQGQVDYPQQYYGVELRLKEHTAADGTVTPAVLVAVGNICKVINKADGQTLDTIQFPAPIVELLAGTNGVQCVLVGGQDAKYFYDTQTPIVSQIYVDELEEAVCAEHVLVMQSGSKQILLYRDDMYDENWQSFSGCDEGFEQVRSSLQTEDCVLIYSLDNTLRCFDAAEKTLRWAFPFEETYYKADFVCTQDNTVLVWLNGKALMRVGLADGTCTPIALEMEVRSETLSYRDGDIFYISRWNEAGADINGVVRLTLETGAVEAYPMDIPLNYNAIQVSEDGERFLLWCSYEESLSLYADGQLYTMEGVAEPELSVFSDVGKMVAVVGLQEIILCDMQLQPKMQIPLNGMHPVTMCFNSSDLLVAYDNDTLYRYWVSTGQMLDKLDIHTRDSREEYVWDFSQPGKLALRISNQLNLIDTTAWELYTHVDFCLGYYPETETALVTGFLPESKYSMGSYRIYSAQDLIDKANGMLAGAELTDEQKSQYGIE